MPCHDGPDTAEEIESKLRSEARDWRKALDERTDMLCRVMRNVEEVCIAPHMFNRIVPVDVQEWWQKHKEHDRIRKEKELQDRETLAKKLAEVNEQNRILNEAVRELRGNMMPGLNYAKEMETLRTHLKNSINEKKDLRDRVAFLERERMTQISTMTLETKCLKAKIRKLQRATKGKKQ